MAVVERHVLKLDVRVLMRLLAIVAEAVDYHIARRFGRHDGEVEARGGEVEIESLAFVGVAEQLVHIPHVAHADGHEREAETGVAIGEGVHRKRFLLFQYGRGLHPVVAFGLHFPVTPRADDVGGVVGVERVVAPVVDFQGKPWETRIGHVGVVDFESVLQQLLYPERIRHLFAGRRGQRVGLFRPVSRNDRQRCGDERHQTKHDISVVLP